MDRRRIAIALCLLGCVVALAFAYATWRCGVSSASESCFSAEDCEAKSECVSYLHPMALPFAGLGLAGAVLAAMRQAYALVVAGAVGILGGIMFGFSMGLVGIGVGALVLAAGVVVLVAPKERLSTV